MIKAVVTGGAGFIGSHLVEELVRRDYRVTILDNLSTGKEKNIEPLLKSKSVEFIKGSITDLPLMEKIFRGVHYVFHLAALPSVPRSITDPKTSHEVNATGTLMVLLAAVHNRVNKVIYSSSSSVYGDTPTLPKQEDMLPNPQSPYAVSKLIGEYYCNVFHRVYSLQTACLRYFNVYGPRQDPNSQYAAVIPRFMMLVSKGNPPTIFGDGEQTRDFTFIRDAVMANVLVAESEYTGVFNIGTGESNSINSVALLITKFMGSDLKAVHETIRPGDIRHSRADISRATSFGYQPKYNLEEGLKQTLDEFEYETRTK